MLLSLYHLPKQHTADLDMFSCSVSKTVDRISAEQYMIIMIGDLNIDLMSINSMKKHYQMPNLF